jgi:ABC-type oligopeptide transport system substrate-binding subunit
MSSTRHNTKFRLTVKLDFEWDADIITWIEAHAKGQRSEIVRTALRKAMQPDVSVIDPEEFRYVIADELEKALSSLRLQSLTPVNTTNSNDDAEVKYGDKLDRMLGNLGQR